MHYCAYFRIKNKFQADQFLVSQTTRFSHLEHTGTPCLSSTASAVRNCILQRCLLSRTLRRRKASWIVYILRRNCLTRHVVEWNIEERIAVRGRWGARRKQLLDQLKETVGYWQLKDEALDRVLWGTGFRKGYGPVIRRTMNNTSFLISIRCVETDQM